MKRPALPSSPSLNRRLGRVKPLSRIVAFCEGKTEKQYLDAFASYVGRRLVEVEFVKEVGVPSTVVSRCIERKNQLEKLASRRGADSFDKDFSVWAVFDRDAHTCYHRAIQDANRNGIRIAFSNPCIELWAVLHLETYGDRPAERREIQKILKQVMPAYDHSRSPTFTFSLMRDRYAFAREQAIRMIESRDQLGDSYGCPATSVYELTDLILASAQPPAERRQKADELKTRVAEIELDPRFHTGDSSLARERSSLLKILREID